jgi:hypothetical protein
MGSITSKKSQTPQYRWVWQLACENGVVKKVLVKRCVDDRVGKKEKS